MFEEIKRNLDEIERIHTKAREESLTGEEYEFLDYFEMTFAKSMMKELLERQLWISYTQEKLCYLGLQLKEII